MIKQVVSAASVAVATGILLLAAATTPELVSARETTVADVELNGADTTYPTMNHDDSPRSSSASPGGRKHRRLTSQYYCPNPIHLDFNRDDMGNTIPSGTYVFDEWRSMHNFRLKAEGKTAQPPNNQARVINTENPGASARLGSPNTDCIGGGPGVGVDGKPGKPGQNCKPLSNALIIQNMNTPNVPLDDDDGGKITFFFDDPAYIVELGMINVIGDGVLRVTLSDGSKVNLPLEGLGANAAQYVEMNMPDIKKVQVSLDGTGGVFSIIYCDPNDFLPADPNPPSTGNDLNLRFNKIPYINNVVPPNPPALPLGPSDYPLSKETADWLRQTDCWTIIRDEECLECDITTEEFMAAVGGPPSHPTDNPNDPFWDELLEVINVQIARVNNIDVTTVMPIPQIWSDLNIAEVAEAVHDEFPGVHHIKLLEGFLREGVQFDRSIVPSKSANEFVRGPVMLADLNTWCMATVGPHNFGLKWQNGRARPEEVANMIRLGQIDPSYYPPAISAALSQLTFNDPTEFTAYDEGCPPHPAWPAMHSAASAGSLWMALVLDLTPEQACEARAVDYAISYARTVAGVHYPTDNIAGLAAGQEILARKLPRYMAWRYGSDPYAVKEKIKSIRFDWNDYLTSDCFA